MTIHTVPIDSTSQSSYLEGCWLCASGLLAVNAIRKQLREPINSGLARWGLKDVMDGGRCGKREKEEELASKQQIQYGSGE